MNPSTINAWLFITAELILLALLLYALFIIGRQRKLILSRQQLISRLTEELIDPLSRLESATLKLKTDNNNEDSKKSLALITSETHRLNLLAGNVSRVVRSGDPSFFAETSSVDLHELLESCCETFGQVHPEIKLSLKNDAKSCIIQADQVQLSNIIYNLLDNALKFNKGNTEISVQTASRGPWIYVSVSDNGQGISAKDLKHIFEPFYRGKALSEVPDGFGLGLAYVNNIVKAHKGSIKAYSKPGVGSTFTLKFRVDS